MAYQGKDNWTEQMAKVTDNWIANVKECGLKARYITHTYFSQL